MLTQTIDNGNLLAAKPLIDEFLQKDRHNLSSFSFVNIFLWKDFFDFSGEVIDGNLCLFARSDVGTFMYLPPLGDTLKTQTIQTCFDIMEEKNKGSGVSRVENVEEKELSLFSAEDFSPYKKCEECVYEKDDIVSLEGNAYKSQRSSYNQFVKNYSFEYALFKKDYTGECLSLYDTWAQKKDLRPTDVVFKDMLRDSRRVHETAMRHADGLGLVGRVIKIDDRIKAYTFGFPLNADTFCILFEITDIAIKGISTFIFRKFCRDEALKNFSFINAMDDFGLDNVKKTKLSFKPAKIIPSFTLARKVLYHGRY